MKKFLFAPLALAGACAACCALPFLPGLFAGLMAAGTGVALGHWAMGLGLAMALVLMWRAFPYWRPISKAQRSTPAPCSVACDSSPAASPCACQQGQVSSKP